MINRSHIEYPAYEAENFHFTPFNFIGDGLNAPISHMFAGDKQPTDDPEEAVVIVAQLPSKHWLSCECFPGEIARRIPS